jgi:cytochrome c peroxidase
MHDGSLPTLEAVVEFYDRGGDANPHLDPSVQPLGLSREEKGALVAFLEALSASDNLIEIARLPGVRDPKRPHEPPPIPRELLR